MKNALQTHTNPYKLINNINWYRSAVFFLPILTKVEISPAKNFDFICFNECSLKMINNTLYFISNLVSFLRYLQFSPGFFGYAGKQFDKKAKENFKIYDVASCNTNNYINILPDISKSRDNEIWSVNRI